MLRGEAQQELVFGLFQSVGRCKVDVPEIRVMTDGRARDDDKIFDMNQLKHIDTFINLIENMCIPVIAQYGKQAMQTMQTMPIS